MLNNPNVPAPKPNVMIMLDTILDTRVGTVRTIAPELTNDILLNKRYRERTHDELSVFEPRLNVVEYFGTYNNNTKEVLFNSKITLMKIYLLKLFSKLDTLVASNNPLIKDVNIYINMYPYMLSEEECNLMKAGLAAGLNLKELPNLVYIPYSDMNLKWFDEKGFSTFIVYDFNGWLSAAIVDESVDEDQIKKIENFCVIAPNLTLKEKDYEEVLTEFKKYGLEENIDYFATVAWALLFDLDYIPSIYFTEFNEDIADRLMSVIEESREPIDLEVASAVEVCNLLHKTKPNKVIINHLLKNNIDLSDELSKEVSNIDDIEKLDNHSFDKVRLILAKQRFTANALAGLLPSQPTLDYENFVNSLMSNFDSTFDHAEITSKWYEDIGIHNKKIEVAIPHTETTVFIHMSTRRQSDTDGNVYEKNDLLPSKFKLDTKLELMHLNELEMFMNNFK